MNDGTENGMAGRDHQFFAIAIIVAAVVLVLALQWRAVKPYGEFNATYYDELADAFLAGQTSFLRLPPPAMMALPDPYYPKDNESFRIRREIPGERFTGVHDLASIRGFCLILLLVLAGSISLTGKNSKEGAQAQGVAPSFYCLGNTNCNPTPTPAGTPAAMQPNLTPTTQPQLTPTPTVFNQPSPPANTPTPAQQNPAPSPNGNGKGTDGLISQILQLLQQILQLLQQLLGNMPNNPGNQPTPNQQTQQPGANPTSTPPNPTAITPPNGSAGGGGSAATIPFNHLLVDPSPSSSIGSGIALGDIDGDGKLDVITADGPTFGDPGQPVVAWYKNPGGEDRGNWTKTIIDSQFGGTDDAQVADIRGNGVMDVITSDYNRGQIVWYENPRNSGGNPSSDPWTRHVIAAGFLHDMAVGDVLGNGKIDVVVHGHFGAFKNEAGPTVLYIQNNPDSWTAVTMTNAPDYNTNGNEKGIALANLAGHTDGKLDLVENGYWLEQPANATDGSAWTAHTFASSALSSAAVAVVDINGDGRLDIVMDASDGEPGALVWYEQGPGNPRDATDWTQHMIDASILSSHMLAIADMNQDGHPDIVWGGPGATGRVGFCLNNGDGSSWTLQLLSTSDGGRPQVGDLGGDGDLDIVSTRDDKVPVDVWYNQSK